MKKTIHFSFFDLFSFKEGIKNFESAVCFVYF